MTRIIRLLMLFEALTFFIAAAIHFQILFDGYGHREAGTAESVIGCVLLIGLVVSLLRPFWTAAAGIWAQSFALLGTFVGIFMILIGVGPQTTADIVYHIGIVIVLVIGLTIAVRTRKNSLRSADLANR